MKYVEIEKGQNGTKIRTETGVDKSTDAVPSADQNFGKMPGGPQNLAWEEKSMKPPGKSKAAD